MSGAAVILQHQDDAPAGLLIAALDRRSIVPEVIRLDRDEPLPNPADVPLAVTLGASAAADQLELPWVARELEWLRAAESAGTPVLGICFGAQILALALGGQLTRGGQVERGWITVSSRRPEVIPTGPWLTWHDDRIGLPPDAELLADNHAGVQAYRAGAHLALQFHPEATPAILEDWIADDGGDSVDAAALRTETERRAEPAAQAAAALFDGFLASRLRGRHGGR